MEGLFLVGTVECFFPVIERLIASSNLIKVLQTKSRLIVVCGKTRVRLGSQVLGNHLLETVAWIGCTVAVSIDLIGADDGCALEEGDEHSDISLPFSLWLCCQIL